MPQAWIKLHTGLLDNPKVMQLSAEGFRVWILVLAVARRHNENGALPPLAQVAYIFHVHPKWLAQVIDTLIAANLIERRADALVVHDWDDWQREYPSAARDAVRERVTRWRANKRADEPRVTTGNESEVVTDDVTRVTPIELDKRREEKTRKEKPASAGNARGARIPDDFGLTDAMARYAVSKGISVDRARSHVEEFALFWKAATKNATALDWVSRWQSRLLRDIHDGHLIPDIRPAAPEPEPQAWTPAEATYHEMQRVLDGEESPDAATPETVAVVEKMGGWTNLRSLHSVGYPAWLGAWNHVHGSV